MVRNHATCPGWGGGLFVAAARRRLDPEVLPTLLHEVCHHWCFHSPVAAAVSVAHLNATRVLAAPRTPTFDDEIHVARLYARAQALSVLLRPIAEGLALFAEFDALPGRSRIQTKPMTFVMMMAGADDAAPSAATSSEGAAAMRSPHDVLRRRLVEVRI